MPACENCGHKQGFGRFCGVCGQPMHKLQNDAAKDVALKDVTDVSPKTDESTVASGSMDLESLKNWVKEEINSPLPHIELGQYYLEHGDFFAAKKEFQVAKSLNPEYLEPYYYLGKSHFFLKNLNQALSEFEKMQEMAKPSIISKDCRYLLIQADGLAYLGRCFEKLSTPERAITCLKQALSYYEQFIQHETIISGIIFEHKEVLYLLIQLLIKKKEFEEARNYLTSLEEQFEVCAESIYLKAELFVQQNFWDGALAEYKKLTQFSDEVVNVHLKIARVYVLSESYDKAILEYENIIREWPENMEGHLKLGQLYKELKMYDKADECFNNLRQLAPDDINLRLEFGYEAKVSGLFRTAIKEFEAVLEFDPYNQKAFLELLDIYENLNNREKIQVYLHSLLEKHPNNIHGLKIKGKSLYQEKEYKKSRKVFQKILYLNNTEIDALYYLGLNQVKLGDYENAGLSFEKIKQLNPEDSRAFALPELIKEDKYFKEGEKIIEQALVAFSKGHLKSAISKVDKALTLLPSQVKWRKLLADLHFKVGNFSRSKSILEGLLVKDKNDPEVLSLLGLLNYVEENTKEALDIYEKLIVLEPEDFNHYLEYLWLLFELYSGTDFFREAFYRRLKHLEQEETLPTFVNFTRRGFLLITIGVFVVDEPEKMLLQAEEYFLSALDNYPDLNPALYGLMKIGCFLKDFPKVFSYYNRMEKTSVSERIHMEFFHFCQSVSRYKEAFRTLDFLIRETDDSIYYRTLKIRFKALEFAGVSGETQKQKELQKYQNAIATGESEPLSFFEYATALLYLGSSVSLEDLKQKIQLALNKCLKLDPDFYWAKWGLMLNFLKHTKDHAFRVNFPTHMAICEKITKERPHDVYSRYFLAHLLLHHPDEKYLKKAEREFVKVLANKKFFIPAYYDLIEVSKKRALRSRVRYLSYRYNFLMGSFDFLE
ncbi:tetratricopeptide repeat protein [Candidatus Riflebacteria bacterium]